ncbi:MAG: N-acetylmuramoyl-L-alanine amidase [Desulfovibrio sp.]|nr:N-acetylmuramoyl-L-alanine amidase [Desulfovibrio sp.]
MGLFRRKLALVTSLLFFCLLHVAFCEFGFCSDLILDPGHSPGKPGATSCSGLPEYQFNDQLVSTIERFLAERGLACDVTRRGREELSLKERGAKARGHKLFLSVHHDSVQPVYLERMHGQLCSRKAHGYSLFVSQKNAFFETSLLYARVLGELLVAMGFQPSTHHGEAIKGENRPLLDPRLGIYQFDDLVVLKTSEAPAILLEAAVIVHPDDERLAQHPAFQRAIAEAVVQTLRFVQNTSP